MKKITLSLLLCLICLSGMAQSSKKLDLKDITSGKYRAENIRNVVPMPDGEHYTQMNEEGTQITKYSFKTGEPVEVIFDVTKARECDFKNFDGYQFSPDGEKLLIATETTPIYRRSYTAVHYLYPLKRNEKGVTTNNIIERLSDGGPQQAPVFSPDGTMIAFVRDNNIFLVKTLYGNSESQVTEDGKPNAVLNGIPDWVYEEEFGFNKALEFSADNSMLAFIRFDETEVPQYQFPLFAGEAPRIDVLEDYPGEYAYKYPKAGEKNSKVSVYVYDVSDRTTTKMDTGEEDDIYLPRIRWTQDPKKLAIIRLNRHQNKMEILLANAKVGTIVPLYREENKYYIDESNLDNLVFLDNGTQFVITSEKSGYMHLYLYDLNGRERQAITKGNFDIIDFYGYDPVRKLFYYSSYEESPLEKYIYSINEKGLKKKLTPVKGWNEASFSKNFNYYINVVSNTDTPPVTALYNAKGKQVRVLEDNKAVKEAVKAYNLAKPEFLQIPAADGKTMLNAWIMKPVNQEAGKKYPLLITQYSGPNSQQVKNNWSLSWLNYLAQEGYIVACIDPRGTAARGEEFRKCTYMQLGKLESDDMIAAAKWLATQPDVDVKNIGIWGWSYGGFMSSLCIMKGNDIFTTAIAVAPVTHYKYYDSIYTERYMRTPAENERGYEDNAPLNWADKLKGNLLICHGTADDNVHVQNTYELAERLVQANKQFDMAIYTNRNHSIFGGNTTLQLYNRFVKYLNEHMKR